MVDFPAPESPVKKTVKPCFIGDGLYPAATAAVLYLQEAAPDRLHGHQNQINIAYNYNFKEGNAIDTPMERNR